MDHHSPDLSMDRTVCRNPATQEILGYSSLTSLDTFRQILKNAQKAQASWSKLSTETRSDYMIRVRDYMVRHSDELADIIAKDNGKTHIDALSAEVMPAIMGIQYYAKRAKKFLKDRRITPGNILLANKTSKIIRVPYGVIGIISPWNYPFSIPFSEVVMGLLAGNAVVLKTATQTQMVGRKLEDCFRAAELPEGVFNFVNLPGNVAGSAFLQNGVNKLFFTGSVAVGKELMKEASKTLTPLVLELGGNDAMLVCEDADVHRSATGAVWAGLTNCGQSCGGVERIYVHEKIYAPFLSALKAKVESLRTDPSNHFHIDLGVMTTQKQVQIVQGHIQDALSKGAKIFARSPKSVGVDARHRLSACVLVNVTHDMLVMKEETFGPVLAVMKVSDMDEALSLANDSKLGLTGSVWSKDRKKAEKLGRQIQAGVITINDHLMSHGLAETPWGGFKSSGIGRTHGAIGFDEMTQAQVIVHDMLPFARQNIWWYPHSRKVYQGISGCIQFLYAKSPVQRFKGLWHLLKIVPRYFTTR